MMPGPAGEVFIAVQVAVGEDIQPGPFLIADEGRHRILKLFAEADVHHAGIERLAPHADVHPLGTWPGASDGTGKGLAGGDGEQG